MGVIVGINQPLLSHVGVDLGAGQAPMSQKILDTSEIRASIKQVGGETVPERVGTGGQVEPDAK